MVPWEWNSFVLWNWLSGENLISKTISKKQKNDELES
jgi:hypothetical protein